MGYSAPSFRVGADAESCVCCAEVPVGPLEGSAREVTYWIDPSRWGRGFASAALEAFLQVELTRPLFARVAEHNIGSAKVLTRAGLVQIGCETSYADGVGRDIVEHIYRLAP